jgi:hypothetical protein
VRQCGAVQARDVISGDDPRMGVFGAAIAEILACYGAAAAALTWINLQESPASGNDDDGNEPIACGRRRFAKPKLENQGWHFGQTRLYPKRPHNNVILLTRFLARVLG